MNNYKDAQNELKNNTKELERVNQVLAEMLQNPEIKKFYKTLEYQDALAKRNTTLEQNMIKLKISECNHILARTVKKTTTGTSEIICLCCGLTNAYENYSHSSNDKINLMNMLYNNACLTGSLNGKFVCDEIIDYYELLNVYQEAVKLFDDNNDLVRSYMKEHFKDKKCTLKKRPITLPDGYQHLKD